jgi:hypothetical protein
VIKQIKFPAYFVKIIDGLKMKSVIILLVGLAIATPSIRGFPGELYDNKKK